MIKKIKAQLTQMGKEVARIEIDKMKVWFFNADEETIAIYNQRNGKLEIR